MRILFAYSGLALALTCLFILIIILRFGKSKLHKVWALFNLAVGCWGAGMWLLSIRVHPDLVALLIWRFSHIGGIFIAVFFSHVIYQFCNLNNKKILFLSYAYGIVFVLLAIFNPY